MQKSDHWIPRDPSAKLRSRNRERMDLLRSIESDFLAARIRWSPRQLAMFDKFVGCNIDIISGPSFRVDGDIASAKRAAMLESRGEEIVRDDAVAIAPHRSGKTAVVAAALAAFARAIPNYSAVAIIPSEEPCRAIDMYLDIKLAMGAMERARPVGTRELPQKKCVRARSLVRNDAVAGRSDARRFPPFDRHTHRARGAFDRGGLRKDFRRAGNAPAQYIPRRRGCFRVRHSDAIRAAGKVDVRNQIVHHVGARKSRGRRSHRVEIRRWNPDIRKCV